MDDTEYRSRYTERRVLLAYLNRDRAAVVHCAQGLSEDQVRTPGVPSGTSLLGIVHHLTGVEQHWFARVFAGEDISPDKSMSVSAGRSQGEVVEAYRQACARSDEIIQACPDLSTRAAIANPGEPERDSLRVILAHMISETARHAGHADILREQIDGTVGL